MAISGHPLRSNAKQAAHEVHPQRSPLVCVVTLVLLSTTSVCLLAGPLLACSLACLLEYGSLYRTGSRADLLRAAAGREVPLATLEVLAIWNISRLDFLFCFFIVEMEDWLMPP